MLPEEIWEEIIKHNRCAVKRAVLQELRESVTLAEWSSTQGGWLIFREGQWVRRASARQSFVMWGLCGPDYQDYTGMRLCCKNGDTYTMLSNAGYNCFANSQFFLELGLRDVYHEKMTDWQFEVQELSRYALFWFYDNSDLYIHKDFFKVSGVLPEMFLKQGEEVGDTLRYYVRGNLDSDLKELFHRE